MRQQMAVWCSVNHPIGAREATIEPFMFSDGKSWEQAPDAKNADAVQMFSQRYFKPGTQYKLLLSGCPAQNITIRHNIAPERFAIDGIGQRGYLLATNAAILPDKPTAVRLVTDEEKKVFEEQIAKLAPADSKITYPQLNARDLYHDGNYCVVGMAVAEPSAAAACTGICLIMRKQAFGWEKLLSHKWKADAEGMSVPSLVAAEWIPRIIDNADMDADNVDELVLRRRMSNRTTYTILGLISRDWRERYIYNRTVDFF